MIRRILAGVFGAVVFGIIIPIITSVAFESIPLDGLNGLLVLVGISVVLGFVLGCSFPKVFGFIFEAFTD